jgi:hypothetical protein
MRLLQFRSLCFLLFDIVANVAVQNAELARLFWNGVFDRFPFVDEMSYHTEHDCKDRGIV